MRAVKANGGSKLKYSYDLKYDIFWAYVESGFADAEELAEDIFVEFKDGRVVGVEIHDASKILGEYWKEPEKAAERAMEIAKRLASVQMVKG